MSERMDEVLGYSLLHIMGWFAKFSEHGVRRYSQARHRRC